jgi:hypothetical protein
LGVKLHVYRALFGFRHGHVLNELLTRRSLTAVPALRVALAVAGSMSLEGEVIGWVAIYRPHQRLRPAGPGGTGPGGPGRVEF